MQQIYLQSLNPVSNLCKLESDRVLEFRVCVKFKDESGYFSGFVFGSMPSIADREVFITWPFVFSSNRNIVSNSSLIFHRREKIFNIFAASFRSSFVFQKNISELTLELSAKFVKYHECATRNVK